MYRKIVVATDGSEDADRAVEIAGQLAAAVQAEQVDLVHVVQHPATLMASGDGGAYVLLEKLYEELQVEGRRILAAAKESVEKYFTGSVETYSLTGPVAESILDFLREGKHDLIVIGRRGLNRIERLLLGSVSSRLTQYAPCSVLVVKNPSRD